MTLDETKQAILDVINKAAQELSADDYQDLTNWAEDDLADEMADIGDKVDVEKEEEKLEKLASENKPETSETKPPAPDEEPGETKKNEPELTEPA
jgi:hypothetical protein